MEGLANLALGFNVAFSMSALVNCAIGVTLGTLIGVLPGVGPLATIGILLPLSFHLPPVEGMIMLAGIYYGSMYGGSTAAILLNLPGHAAAAIVCLDGHPMARQGRAGIALFMTTISSFVGSVFGIFVLATFTPILAGVALRFGAPDYFALMVLGLLAAALVGDGTQFRNVAMVVTGLLLGIVGADVHSGQYRFVFGIPGLADGISLVVVTTGIFGISEVMSNAGRLKGSNIASRDITWQSMIPSREDWRQSAMPMLRGSGIGGGIGILPGSGPALATFVAYAIEKRVSRTPDRFGHGAIEGIAAPESANNSAAQTSFVPTLSLGIPGDPIVAVMLGALIIHGITPGPRLITENPELFWGLTVSFLIGNLMLLILNLPLIGMWIRLLKVPYRYLYPAIIIFVCIGVYSLANSVFDVILVLIFGLAGYGLKLLQFSPAPLLLGLVLGPLLEENFRRALRLSRGDLMVFISEPISATFLAMAAVLVTWLIWSTIRNRRRGAEGR